MEEGDKITFETSSNISLTTCIFSYFFLVLHYFCLFTLLVSDSVMNQPPEWSDTRKLKTQSLLSWK